jgi:8-oxo-dGTP diphosphatase
MDAEATSGSHGMARPERSEHGSSTVDFVGSWTGRSACLLQEAMRLTNEAFAERLGISARTITRWHANPEKIHRTEVQQILDLAYERAGEAVHRRFALLIRPPADSGPAQAQALRVAIAVVIRGDDVLLVCRRGDGTLRWQFPAGMVKPGADPQSVAIQETHGETGVHVTIREPLGDRIHPETRVLAAYFLCDYLAGDAANLDTIENIDVAWVPRSTLTRFIPAEQIFPPVLSALEVAA